MFIYPSVSTHRHPPQLHCTECSLLSLGHCCSSRIGKELVLCSSVVPAPGAFPNGNYQSPFHSAQAAIFLERLKKDLFPVAGTDCEGGARGRLV